MVSGSFSSKIDSNEFRLIPSFLTDTSALYRKHIESKYNEISRLYNGYRRSGFKFYIY